MRIRTIQKLVELCVDNLYHERVPSNTVLLTFLVKIKFNEKKHIFL